MAPNDRPPTRASGAIIALMLVLGTAVGVVLRQPTIGLLGGFGLGVAIALMLWWWDERR